MTHDGQREPIIDPQTGEEITVVPMGVALKDKDRLSVQVQAIHEHWGDKPHVAARSWSEMLATIAEPYSRKITVSEAWQPLIDARCWVDEPGTVMVENISGGESQVILSDEEKADIARRVLVLAISTQDAAGPVEIAEFSPGQCLPPLKVRNIASFVVRCEHGQATARLHVFPR
jgi:hypothetical protein